MKMNLNSGYSSWNSRKFAYFLSPIRQKSPPNINCIPLTNPPGNKAGMQCSGFAFFSTSTSLPVLSSFLISFLMPKFLNVLNSFYSSTSPTRCGRALKPTRCPISSGMSWSSSKYSASTSEGVRFTPSPELTPDTSEEVRTFRPPPPL